MESAKPPQRHSKTVIIDGGAFIGDSIVPICTSIKSRKPNLAICVYHRPNGIVDIPLYLKSLVPEYKIYLVGGCHTICTAFVE